MKIAVKDLRPNPFRHLERYPIDQTKIDALKRSIKDTTFWDNLLVRKAPNGDDGYEIAYGHHRLHALKKCNIDEVDLPVRKLTDTDMARIMAHENMEEWGTSAPVEQETLRAIIEGFAEGKVELPTVARSGAGTVRYAPSFVVSGNNDSGRPESSYTAASLADFLGWNVSKVEAILNSLAVIEKGIAKESDFEGLTTWQAERVASQARRAEKQTGDAKVARHVAREISAGIRAASGVRPGRGSPPKGMRQQITMREAPKLADRIMQRQGYKVKASKKMPDIEQFAEQIVASLLDVPTEKMKEKLDALVKYRKELHTKTRTRLVSALRSAADRLSSRADKLEG